MINIEALKTSVDYKLDDAFIEKILLDRGLESQGTYQGISAPFMLAKADIYAAMVVNPAVSEGDLNITVSDKAMLMEIANTIYRRYEEYDSVLTERNNCLRDRSDAW